MTFTYIAEFIPNRQMANSPEDEYGFKAHEHMLDKAYEKAHKDLRAQGFSCTKAAISGDLVNGMRLRVDGPFGRDPYTVIRDTADTCFPNGTLTFTKQLVDTYYA